MDGSLLESIERALAGQRCAWHITSSPDATSPWISAHRPDRALPAQGWKLHVSSFGCHAAETLRRVLPVLVTRGETFKVVASIDWLGQINRWNAGLAQIGKFITVYPRCEHDAVEVSMAL